MVEYFSFSTSMKFFSILKIKLNCDCCFTYMCMCVCVYLWEMRLYFCSFFWNFIKCTIKSFTQPWYLFYCNWEYPSSIKSNSDIQFLLSVTSPHKLQFSSLQIWEYWWWIFLTSQNYFWGVGMGLWASCAPIKSLVSRISRFCFFKEYHIRL